MQPNNDIYASALLAILLIATNLKPILLFREWLYFRIRIIFKQHLNERKNKTDYRP
jgi:hypothetical protein